MPLNAILQKPLYNILHPRFSRVMQSVESSVVNYAAATTLGLISGYPTMLAKSPLSYGQVQMQCDITTPLHSEYRFKGSLDALEQAFRTGGLSSFATGMGAFMAAVVTERRAKAFVYDLVAPQLISYADSSLAAILLYTAFEAGGVLASWPLTTIRRRMIVASAGAVDRHTGKTAAYANPLAAARQIYDKEGLSAFWSGWHLRLGFILVDAFINVAVQNVLERIFE